MPPPAPSAALTKPNKPYFFYGHRKPTQNRPIVRGGLFSNRQILNPKKFSHPITAAHESFDLQKWDPDDKVNQKPPYGIDPSEKFFSLAKNLSPIARYIVDAFRKHKQWNPQLVAELNRLRRVTPKLVAEVLKFPDVDPRLSSKFFHWAGKQKGYKHDFACYNAFAYFLNRANHFRAADQVPELMHMQGKPPSEKQFEVLIRMHADVNRGLRIHYVYEKMKKFGVKPRVFLYNRIMDALVKTNHLDLAMSVYDDFKEDGLVEENVTYMILIKGLCKAGRMDEVFVLPDRMRKNCVQAGCVCIYSNGEGVGFEGNLDGCLTCGRKCKRISRKRMKEFCKLLEQMQKFGFSVSDDLLKLFSGMLEKNNGVVMALEVFECLKTQNYLTVPIYNELMEALLKNDEEKKALALFHELIDFDLEACTCYNKIKEMSSVPSVAAYYSLVKGLSEIGAADAAMMLVRDCLAHVASGPMEFKHTLTIIHVCKLNDARKVVEVLNEMVDQGCCPSSITYSAIIYGMCKHGTIEEARNVFSIMRESNCLSEADVIVYDEMLIDHMKKTTADLLLSGIKFFGLESKLKAKGCTFLPS
ncbi:hypothetical protein DH2020_035044 [Rehmannia glutinosa]|uniref:Pentatricopeptide repeat-containing protein n=1 Tax=Rehmannia glutinosa TaxID=99300 RepID=A0ABR0V7M7_REHGL